jgi:hypothetical protein
VGRAPDLSAASSTRGPYCSTVRGQRDPLPTGWEKLENPESFHVADEAMQRYIHSEAIYRHGWESLTRWWPWRKSALFHWDVRLPDPSVTFDTGPEFELSDPHWTDLAKDFHAKALDAFRSLTPPQGFIYAVDTDYEGYRFWPHKGIATERWPLGVPGSIDWNSYWESFLAPPDFSWVFSASLRGDRITVSGRGLLDAFERNKPLLFSKTVVDDDRGPPTHADAEDFVRQTDPTMKAAKHYLRRQEAQPSQVRHKRAR